jgi:hypothetical protein
MNMDEQDEGDEIASLHTRYARQVRGFEIKTFKID